jgi:hypothetical protein
MKKCGVAAAPITNSLTPETVTPEQIQYILIENRILKELLKTAIHGTNV